MLEHFETILPSVDKKVRYMGEDVCWRPMPSPNMVAILAAILDFTKN